MENTVCCFILEQLRLYFYINRFLYRWIRRSLSKRIETFKVKTYHAAGKCKTWYITTNGYLNGLIKLSYLALKIVGSNSYATRWRRHRAIWIFCLAGQCGTKFHQASPAGQFLLENLRPRILTQHGLHCLFQIFVTGSF